MATEKVSAEIFSKEGTEVSTFVWLYEAADGRFRLFRQDIGPRVEEASGGRDNDYEFWVDIAPSDVPKLLFALLREKYHGRIDAVDELTDFCKKESVPHQWGWWD